MGTFKTLEEARDFFKKDTFAAANGMVIEEISEDSAVCSMVIRDDHKNAYGGIMGGVIFTLADFAFAVTANNIHQLTVAQQVNINYISAPKGNTLKAFAKCRKSGKTSTIIQVDVTDEIGRDIAAFTGTGFKL